MTADFNVQIRVRNGRLLRAIREQFGTAAELCRVSGINRSGVSALLSMRSTPFRKDGSLTSVAEAIVSALGIPAGELWPDHIAHLKARKATVEIDIDADGLAALSSDVDADTVLSCRKAIQMLAVGLTDRQVYVLSQRMTGANLDDVAREIGVSRERVRQIENAAVRKMRVKALRQGIRSLEQIV